MDKMTYLELEQHIKDVGSLMATSCLQYEQSGCFADRGSMDGYQLQMDEALSKRDADKEQS